MKNEMLKELLSSPSTNEVCGACGGELKFYDGALGYESFRCVKCGHDCKDYPHGKTPLEYASRDLAQEVLALRDREKVLVEALKNIGEYKGEGGPNTPWQEIVRDCGEMARAALMTDADKVEEAKRRG